MRLRATRTSAASAPPRWCKIPREPRLGVQPGAGRPDPGRGRSGARMATGACARAHGVALRLRRDRGGDLIRYPRRTWRRVMSAVPESGHQAARPQCPLVPSRHRAVLDSINSSAGRTSARASANNTCACGRRYQRLRRRYGPGGRSTGSGGSKRADMDSNRDNRGTHGDNPDSREAVVRTAIDGIVAAIAVYGGDRRDSSRHSRSTDCHSKDYRMRMVLWPLTRGRCLMPNQPRPNQPPPRQPQRASAVVGNAAVVAVIRITAVAANTPFRSRSRICALPVSATSPQHPREKRIALKLFSLPLVRVYVF